MVTLITGASRGIGRAIAQELAEASHDLILVAKSETHLAIAQTSISARAGQRIVTFACDLSDPMSPAHLYSFAEREGLDVNALVLGAGIFIEGSLTTSSVDDLNATLRVNLTSAFTVVSAFIKKLRNSKSPRIILIGSTAGAEPYPTGALYGVSKWALRGFAANLRSELRKDGVAVTLISPGGTLTDLWSDDDVPEGRLLEPRDIAKVVKVCFELSPQAVVEEVVVRPMLGDLHGDDGLQHDK